MGLVIKRSIDLSDLSADYSGISFVFRSIPAKDLAELNAKQESFEKDEEGNPDISVVIPYFTELLQKYFVSGKQDQTELVKEDISELDVGALVYCFQILTGQAIDPKDDTPSKTTSSMESETQ